MRRYYFKLVDGHLAANYGVHDLEDETAAHIAAIELARSIRQDRPELVGQHYSISVPIEIPCPTAREARGVSQDTLL